MAPDSTQSGQNASPSCGSQGRCWSLLGAVQTVRYSTWRRKFIRVLFGAVERSWALLQAFSP
eukprot:724006-Pyramimonas_sp.AAC.1